LKLQKYINTKGRISRIEFFIYKILLSILGWLFSLPLSIYEANYAQNPGSYDHFMIYSYLAVYLCFAGISVCIIYIRRLNDLGLSKLWLLILFVPIINFFLYLFCLFKKGNIGPNEHGDDPLETDEIKYEKKKILLYEINRKLLLLLLF